MKRSLLLLALLSTLAAPTHAGGLQGLWEWAIPKKSSSQPAVYRYGGITIINNQNVALQKERAKTKAKKEKQNKKTQQQRLAEQQKQQQALKTELAKTQQAQLQQQQQRQAWLQSQSNSSLSTSPQNLIAPIIQ
jgi:hypothetical protein